MRNRLILKVIGLFFTQLSFSQIVDIDYTNKKQSFIEDKEEKQTI